MTLAHQSFVAGHKADTVYEINEICWFNYVQVYRNRQNIKRTQELYSICFTCVYEKKGK